MENLMKVVRSALLGAAVLALVSLGALAQYQSGSAGAQSSAKSSKSSSSGQLDAADKKFVMEAAEGGMAEVELGKLATQNAQSDQVKQFGQRMVDDHTKANDELKKVAEQKGITLPTQISAKDQALKDKLSKLKGEQFDRAYMQDMVKDHKKDVAEFKKASTTAKDSDVKNFASKTLPTLEDHLKQAQQVESAEMSPSHAKKSSTTASSNPKQ